MKGAELSINVVIVIVLCLIVLLVIVALVFGVVNIFPESLETAKTSACNMLMETNGCGISGSTNGISISNFDANKDGKIGEPGTAGDDTSACGPGSSGDDNLFMLCKCWFNVNEDLCEKNVCNCPSG